MTKDTIPSGMDLLLGGSCVTTPATVALWANHKHQVIVHTASGSLSLQSWPDGAFQVIAIDKLNKVVPHMPIDAYHYGQHALAIGLCQTQDVRTTPPLPRHLRPPEDQPWEASWTVGQ
jgi:hypothetical protein